MNVAEHLDDADRPETPQNVVFSDDEADDRDDQGGDYSARLEELMSDDDEHGKNGNGVDEEDEDEGFFYTGVDAPPAGSYREQLRDVLGPDHDIDDTEEPEVDNSLIHDVAEKEKFEASMDDEARVSLPSIVNSWQ